MAKSLFLRYFFQQRYVIVSPKSRHLNKILSWFFFFHFYWLTPWPKEYSTASSSARLTKSVYYFYISLNSKKKILLYLLWRRHSQLIFIAIWYLNWSENCNKKIWSFWWRIYLPLNFLYMLFFPSFYFYSFFHWNNRKWHPKKSNRRNTKIFCHFFYSCFWKYFHVFLNGTHFLSCIKLILLTLNSFQLPFFCHHAIILPYTLHFPKKWT